MGGFERSLKTTKCMWNLVKFDLTNFFYSLGKNNFPRLLENSFLAAPTFFNKIKVVGTALTFSFKERVGAVLTSLEPSKEGQCSKEDMSTAIKMAVRIFLTP